MGENRYFVDQHLAENAQVTLPPSEAQHLRVMRKKTDDAIELVNGRGQLARALLVTPQTAQILSVTSEPPPPKTIILAQALLKPKGLDLVIEKGTELGASAFWLFPGDRSRCRSLSDRQRQRLRGLTISALKQSGRLDLPAIIEKEKLCDWKPVAYPLFFGDPTSTTPFAQATSLIIAIGPESGFSTDEIAHLKALGAQEVSLGRYTLRAETAALCALAQSI